MRKRILILTSVVFILFSCAHFKILENESQQNISRNYIDRNYDQAIELSHLYLNEHPDDILVNYYLGRALIDSNQNTDEAIESLLKAIEFDKDSTWISSWSYFYLGVYYSDIEKLDIAKKYFNKVIVLKKTKNSVSSARKRLFLITDFSNSFEKRSTDHINFFFEKPENIENINQYINTREEAFLSICETLKVNPNFKLDFYAWNDGGEVYDKYGIILGFSISDKGIIHSVFNQTIGHEITHSIAFHLYMGNKTTPLINEGVAVYFDFRKNSKIIDRIKQFEKMKPKKVDMNELWNNWRNIPHQISYPVSGGFIEFLIEKEGLEKLILLIADQSYENANRIYNNQFGEYLLEYEEFINSLYESI